MFYVDIDGKRRRVYKQSDGGFYMYVTKRLKKTLEDPDVYQASPKPKKHKIPANLGLLMSQNEALKARVEELEKAVDDDLSRNDQDYADLVSERDDLTNRIQDFEETLQRTDSASEDQLEKLSTLDKALAECKAEIDELRRINAAKDAGFRQEIENIRISKEAEKMAEMEKLTRANADKEKELRRQIEGTKDAEKKAEITELLRINAENLEQQLRELKTFKDTECNLKIAELRSANETEFRRQLDTTGRERLSEIEALRRAGADNEKEFRRQLENKGTEIEELLSASDKKERGFKQQLESKELEHRLTVEELRRAGVEKEKELRQQLENERGAGTDKEKAFGQQLENIQKNKDKECGVLLNAKDVEYAQLSALYKDLQEKSGTAIKSVMEGTASQKAIDEITQAHASEVEQLKLQILEMESAKEDEIEHRTQQLSNEITELEDVIKKADAKHQREMDALGEQFGKECDSELEARVRAVSEEYEARIGSVRDALQKEKSELNDALSTESRSLEECFASKETKIQQIRSELERANSSIREQLEQCETQSAEKAELSSAVILEKDAELKKRDKQISKLEIDKNRCKTELEDELAAITDLFAKNEQLKHENGRISVELESRDTTISALEADLNELRGAYETVEIERDSYKRTYEEFATFFADLRATVLDEPYNSPVRVLLRSFITRLNPDSTIDF